MTRTTTALLLLGIALIAVVAVAVLSFGDDSEASTGQPSTPPTTSSQAAPPSTAPEVSRDEAIERAQLYVDSSAFSYAGLYEQLTNEVAEGYPADIAKHAVDNVEADWMAEAVEAAEQYQRVMPMPREQLYEMLTSEYGDGFTPEEAEHALAAVGM
ncbi:Ltp family lipoprotein [Corynebacterium camporealensis]